MNEQENKTDQLKEFCQTTPLHGFQSVQGSRSLWKKILWIILIVAACTLGAYQICSVIIEYYRYKTAFSVSLVMPDSMPFPDVMICDSNADNYTSKQKLGIAGERKLIHFIKRFSTSWKLENLVAYHEKRLSKGTGKNNDTSTGKQAKLFEYLDSVETLQRQHNLTFLQLVLKLGHSVDKMLLHCTKGQKNMTSGTWRRYKCREIAKPLVYRNFGICYLIRGHIQFKSETVYGGFGALLNTHVQFNRESYQPKKDRPEGVYIGIAYIYEDEFDSIMVSAIPSTYAMIHVKVRRRGLVNHPNDHCTPLRNTSKAGCYKRCELAAFWDTCHCVPVLFYHLVPDIPVCEIRQVVNCMQRHSKSLLNTTRNCQNKCLKPCTEWHYDTSESVMHYKYAENETRKKWDSKTNIQIFMTRLEYQLFQQFYTMTSDTLLGSIGGLFGIYIGGSVLAILHCIFMVLEFGGNFRKKEKEAVHKATDTEEGRAFSHRQNRKGSTKNSHNEADTGLLEPLNTDKLYNWQADQVPSDEESPQKTSSESYCCPCISMVAEFKNSKKQQNSFSLT